MATFTWYNFVERRVDDLDRAPIDDIEGRQYIPQEPASFNYYSTLRSQGVPFMLAVDMTLDRYGAYDD